MRHLDVSGQKLSPHCLETIFDSQLLSPKLSPKMPPKLSLPHRRGHFFLFQNYPCGEGNCEAIERQKLSRGNFCPGTSRCLAGPTGPETQIFEEFSLFFGYFFSYFPFPIFRAGDPNPFSSRPTGSQFQCFKGSVGRCCAPPSCR